MEILATIDRIEEGRAVLLVREAEDAAISWPVRALPQGVREGMILKIRVEPDEKATEAAKHRVERLLRKLASKGPKDPGGRS